MNRAVDSAAPLVAIIDDEEDIVTYLRLALEDHGFRVLTISDSSAALEILVDASPDLIVLDLLMPRRTGVKVYAEISAQPQLAGVPIVIVSGLTPREDLPAILEQAGNLEPPVSFLEKPIKIEELLAVVEDHVLKSEGWTL